LFLVDEKIKLKISACSLENYLLILKLFQVNRFKDPKAAILPLKMLQEATCDSAKSYRKPALTS
jgi:hypothetical protein